MLIDDPYRTILQSSATRRKAVQIGRSQPARDVITR